MKPLYWRLGGVAIALLLLVATWFILVNPQRTQAGDLETARQDQLAQSAALQAKISLLKKQAEELPRKEAELAAIQQKLPPSAAIPSLIRTLNRTARRAKVTMSTLTPGQPTAIKAATPAGSGSSAAANDAEGSAEQSNPDATPSAAPKPSAASALVQAIPVSLTACGSYSQLRNFLVQLESMERAMLITGLNIGKGDCGEGGDDRTLTASITASVFTMPAPQPAAVYQPTPSASPAGGPR